MRTIEVYDVFEEQQTHICSLRFITDKEFTDMLIRLTTSAPFNSLRRDRREACFIRAIYSEVFATEYYTDKVNQRILNICTEYQMVYGYARQLAQKKCWLYAWKYGTEQWQQKMILKQIPAAWRKLKGKVYTGIK